jgi:hypothetical protein
LAEACEAKGKGIDVSTLHQGGIWLLIRSAWGEGHRDLTGMAQADDSRKMSIVIPDGYIMVSNLPEWHV